MDERDYRAMNLRPSAKNFSNHPNRWGATEKTIKIFIGIDPDIVKSGYAVYDKSDKSLQIYNKTFPEILEDFAAWNCPIHVVIEAGWHIKKSNWHKAQGNYVREKIAKNVGENHAVGKLLAEYCQYNNISYELVKPKGKVNSKYFEKLTGIKRSNPETRDAAMLVFGR